MNKKLVAVWDWMAHEGWVLIALVIMTIIQHVRIDKLESLLTVSPAEVHSLVESVHDLVEIVHTDVKDVKSTINQEDNLQGNESRQR